MRMLKFALTLSRWPTVNLSCTNTSTCELLKKCTPMHIHDADLTTVVGVGDLREMYWLIGKELLR